MADEEDKLLPIANVGRIMKQILPPGAKISKEAKQTVQECATEFISFVTGEASDKCHKENRKTLNGDDICWAMSTLGLDEYADGMERYLNKFRKAEKEKERETPNKTSSKEEGSSRKSSSPEVEAETPASFRVRVLEKGKRPLRRPF